jgi:2-polyprenyl-3-methyl-5-hydroxy-6-metoxy-1,4-benzoquinol methylase
MIQHEVQWTREKAGRFWKFLATTARDEDYFSAAVGRDIVAEAKRRGIDVQGRVLDYGCGPGHLLRHLVSLGVACEGADFDRAALDAATARLGDSAKFRGATLIDRLPSSLAADSYDVVFLVETIEHLIGADLPNTLVELRRILRPGGQVVITTPNEENLDANKRLCPDCGCVFHIVQHVSSWSRHSLSVLLRGAGFEQVACDVLTFHRNPRLRLLHEVVDRARRKPPQHLLYVGRKPA